MYFTVTYISFEVSTKPSHATCYTVVWQQVWHSTDYYNFLSCETFLGYVYSYESSKSMKSMFVRYEL